MQLSCDSNSETHTCRPLNLNTMFSYSAIVSLFPFVLIKKKKGWKRFAGPTFHRKCGHGILWSTARKIFTVSLGFPVSIGGSHDEWSRFFIWLFSSIKWSVEKTKTLLEDPHHPFFASFLSVTCDYYFLLKLFIGCPWIQGLGFSHVEDLNMDHPVWEPSHQWLDNWVLGPTCENLEAK